MNVIVRELAALECFLAEDVEEGQGAVAKARVHRLPGPERSPASEQEQGAEVGAGMRAVAPPVQSFAMGRRR